MNCTRSGKTHLYWTYDLKGKGGLEPSWILYFLLMFSAHIYLGDKYRFASMMTLGLGVAWYFSKGPPEVTSLWCAYSVPYILSAEIGSLMV